MAGPPHAKSGFQKWQDTIRRARCDTKWAEYDADIRRTVGEFNTHLKPSSGYVPLDWRLIKAMAWTETGAAASLWKSNPMQIGMFNDPGLDQLLSGAPASRLILPAWKQPLTRKDVRTTPLYNIRAGVGYLLLKLARFEVKDVLNKDNTIHQLTVKAGDSFDKLAHAHGSTVAVMQALNPGVRVLHPGQVLKYQKASRQTVIAGWRAATTANVAMYYNGGGDAAYAKKLDFALSVIQQGNVPPCRP